MPQSAIYLLKLFCFNICYNDELCGHGRNMQILPKTHKVQVCSHLESNNKTTNGNVFLWLLLQTLQPFQAFHKNYQLFIDYSLIFIISTLELDENDKIGYNGSKNTCQSFSINKEEAHGTEGRY